LGATEAARMGIKKYKPPLAAYRFKGADKKVQEKCQRRRRRA